MYNVLLPIFVSGGEGWAGSCFCPQYCDDCKLWACLLTPGSCVHTLLQYILKPGQLSLSPPSAVPPSLNEEWEGGARAEPGDRAQRTHLPSARVRSELIHRPLGKNNPSRHTNYDQIQSCCTSLRFEVHNSVWPTMCWFCYMNAPHRYNADRRGPTVILNHLKGAAR